MCDQNPAITRDDAGEKTNAMTHSGEKPHNCFECSYATTHFKSQLERYSPIHTAGKPFKCSECSFTINDKTICSIKQIGHFVYIVKIIIDNNL